MARGLNKFFKGLRFEGGEASQKEVAEETIKKQLFIIMNELDLENGQTIEMNKIVKLISDKLGVQLNKNKIAQIVTQIFQNGEYKQKINEQGNVEIVLSTADILQKQRDDRIHEEAENMLHGFVEQVQEYVKKLEQQHVKVTEITLSNNFSPEEIEKNGTWIDLAIDHVLEKRNQEK